MANISPDDLGAVIQNTLTLYADDVQNRVNAIGLTAIKELVKITKSTAPRGRRVKHFGDNITYKVETKTSFTGAKTYTWYVKAPDYRLTHLLVHGHQTRNGGRTRKNPFLENAVDQVVPKYTKDVEEAVKK
jgi:hypothetical protein